MIPSDGGLDLCPIKGANTMATSETIPAASRTQSTPTFFEALSIADSLAQKFANTFPSKEANPNWRGYVRTYCIPGLRWLWKSGDANTRTTLAARVAIWRDRKTEDVKALQTRILSRELARVEGGAL